MCIGDSNTVAPRRLPDAGQRNYCARIGNFFDGLEAINKGCLGATTADFLDANFMHRQCQQGSAYRRVVRSLAKRPELQPGWFHINLGTNDIIGFDGACPRHLGRLKHRRACPAAAATYEANLGALVDDLRQRYPAATILLSSPPDAPGLLDLERAALPGYREAIDRIVASRPGGVCWGLDFAPYVETPDYIDGLHYDLAAHGRIAEALIARIRALERERESARRGSAPNGDQTTVSGPSSTAGAKASAKSIDRSLGTLFTVCKQRPNPNE